MLSITFRSCKPFIGQCCAVRVTLGGAGGLDCQSGGGVDVEFATLPHQTQQRVRAHYLHDGRDGCSDGDCDLDCHIPGVLSEDNSAG